MSGLKPKSWLMREESISEIVEVSSLQMSLAYFLNQKFPCSKVKETY